MHGISTCWYTSYDEDRFALYNERKILNYPKCVCGKETKTPSEIFHGMCMDCHISAVKNAMENGIIVEY
jgi:hypothetical protein